MVKIKFGPAGIGKVVDVEETFPEYSKKGFAAAEIPFTYGAYIKNEETAREVGEAADKNGIRLSIHAPYWINLNSAEEEKIEASKKRILDSARVGHWLGQKEKTRIVFHCGFYGGTKDLTDEKKALAYDNIVKGIREMMVEIKKDKWSVELCPEVMGKKGVFGSIDEISRVVKETGCGFCIDFAHSLARYGEYEFDKILKAFPRKDWHCHFSGIEYGDKGEKKHKMASGDDWRIVLDFLKGVDKDVVIICESPDPVGDSVKGLEVWKGLD